MSGKAEDAAMTYDIYDFGVESFDRLTGGGIPAGTVASLFGPPGIGKSCLAFRFLSRGFELDQLGLFVSFTSVPVRSMVTKLRGKEAYSALLSTDHPVILSAPDLENPEPMIGLIEKGEVERLVLDRPEVMLYREVSGWFGSLEEILHRARSMGIGTLMIEGRTDGSAGRYLTEGLLRFSDDQNGRRRFEVLKWPRGPKGAVTEEGEGLWPS